MDNEETEILNFFKAPKTAGDIQKEFGAQKTADILSKYIPREYIKLHEGKFVLHELGKKHLTHLGSEKEKELIKELTKNPSFVALFTLVLTLVFTIPITAYVTHQNTLSSIQYQKTISLTLIGPQEVTVPINQTIAFNNLAIYNPTSSKISLMKVSILNDKEWQRWTSQYSKTLNNQNDNGETPSVSSNTTKYNIPQLQQSYEPYMELEAGDTKLMNDYFMFPPTEKGKYTLTFYIETMDGNIYYVDRPLIITVT